MIVHLLRENWTLVVESLGESMPQVCCRIADELARTTDAIVAVEGQTPGWRAACDRLEERKETYDIGRMVRLMCCASEAELW